MRGMGAIAGILVGAGAIGVTGETAQARQDNNLSTTAMPATKPNLLDQLRQEVASTQQHGSQPATQQPAVPATAQPQQTANPAPAPATAQPGGQSSAVSVGARADAPIRVEDMSADQRQALATELMGQGVGFAAQQVADKSTQSQLTRVISIIGARGEVSNQQLNDAIGVIHTSRDGWNRDGQRFAPRAGAAQGVVTDEDIKQLNAHISAKRETAIAQVNDFLRGKVQIALFTRIERDEARARDPNRGGLLDKIGSDIRRAGDDIVDFGRDIVTIEGHPASGPSVPRSDRRANQEFHGANPRDAETVALLNRVAANCNVLGFDIMNSENQTRAAAAAYVDATGHYRTMTRAEVDSITNGTLVPRASTVEAVRELNTQVERLATTAQSSRAAVEAQLQTIQGRLTPEQWQSFQAAYRDQQAAAERVSRQYVLSNPTQHNLPAGAQTGDARKIITNYVTGSLQQGATALDRLGGEFLDAVNERGPFARR